MSRLIAYSVFALLITAEPMLAQVVQLPTFRFFGTSTTVSVPDHGTAVIGGNTTAYSGSNSRGTPLLGPTGPLFNNRGIANGGTTSQMSVTAQIHDMDAMDRALLGGMSADEFRRQVQANKDFALYQPPGTIVLGKEPQHHAPISTGTWGVAPPRRNWEDRELDVSADLKRQSQAADQLAMGQAMAARGKITLAQSYYRMALNNANGELRAQVLQAQAELSNTAATPGPERK